MAPKPKPANRAARLLRLRDSKAAESEIDALGRRLLAAAPNGEAFLLTPRWFQERLLTWATSDPDFRVKLLRFVDVLPALRSAGAVADHVRQYFKEDTPALIHAGAGLAGAGVFRPAVSRVVREGVYAMAGRFIAGETPADAVPRLKELTSSGTAYTVDLLGEATLSDMEADVYARRYRELLETLAGEVPGPAGNRWQGVPEVNISVKLSSLCSHFEPAAPEYVSQTVRSRLMPLLLLAQDRGVFINVDVEQQRYKDLVQRTFADAVLSPELRDFPHIGIVVQAYLKSAESDLEFVRQLARKRGTPISVRLVKGAYWEEEGIIADQNEWETPVFGQKAATDASFERCTDALLDARPHLRPVFGSHNPRSIAQAAVKSRERGLEDEVEFQMLFGMADTLREAVAAEGFRTRVYTPLGVVIPGMAYLVRRLLENTSNQSWFVREAGDAPPEEVLAAPAPDPRFEPQARPPRFYNTSLAQLHDPDVRERFRDAMHRVTQVFGGLQPLLLASEHVRDRELAEVRYPADPAILLGKVAQATQSDVATAVAVAKTAFPAWRDLPVTARADMLRRAAGIMEERRDELAALMVYESAKPWREADSDLCEACDYLRYYAGQAESVMQPLPLGIVLGEENLYVREPRGVAAIIAPWNFPLAIITGMSAAALAAGNCAILKPAAQSPLIAARLVDILRQAGIPPEIVHYVPGSGSEAGNALVEHPDVDIIAFTGSKAVGMSIIQKAGELRAGQRNVKRVIAEMGGKNAVIIDDDADLDQAVAGVVAAAFGYAGQKCSACSRLIVVGSAYDETVERLRASVESLVVGPPHDPATVVPPVISGAAQTRILDYIEAGKKTARLLVQGGVPGPQGFYVPPSVFVDVSPHDRLAREEIFGPVLSVFRANDIQHALEMALDSEFALTGGLFSRNPRNIALVRREFRVGNLYVNRKNTGAVVSRQPFGGLAHSGAGDKAGGPDYLLQFLQPRTITENTMRRGFAPKPNP
jgi:RHH-type proline utilization regulon transcriptional repressor/proline dehydrogenase/delta 1-pyrroline-5-carboxylate dehydrogenase